MTNDDGKTFYYDLYLPSCNAIIEFHGAAFHADPNLSASEILKWKHPFQENITYQLALSRDATKRELVDKMASAILKFGITAQKKNK